MNLEPGSTSESMPFFAKFGAVLVFSAFCLAAAPAAEAQQLIYRPVNPSFGGNPLNFQGLLTQAEMQRRRDEPDRFARDPFDDFQQGLQRQILAALSRELVFNRFGRDLDLTRPGRFDLGDFIIEIIPGLTGVEIRIINVLTGDETTVTIPNF